MLRRIEREFLGSGCYEESLNSAQLILAACSRSCLVFRTPQAGRFRVGHRIESVVLNSSHGLINIEIRNMGPQFVSDGKAAGNVAQKI